MNAFRATGAGLLALIAIAACASPPPAADAPAVNAPPPPARAQAGDTVFLVEHYVLPDGREQFERFVDEIFWPALGQVAETDPSRQRVLRQTRMLRPLAPNENGFYIYTFVLDPLVPGEAYNVLDILREVYPEEEARDHYRQFTGTWAREFTPRRFIQFAEPVNR